MKWEEMRKHSRLGESAGVPRAQTRYPPQASDTSRGRGHPHRPPSDSWAGLSVVAIDLAGRKSPGLSADPSPGELSLFFGRRTAPGYRPGEIVYLCMRSPCLSRPLVAASWVRRAEATDWGRMYTFKFVDWPGLLSQIPRELAGLFSQRSDRRVFLDSHRPVELTIDGLPPVSWEQVFAGQMGMLLDLSPRGLSFRVDPDVGHQLLECKSVQVSFTLPETAEELSFWVQILSCVADSESIYCGALFDEARTEDFHEKQKKLVSVLQGHFSSDVRVSDDIAGSFTSDYIRVWAEN